MNSSLTFFCFCVNDSFELILINVGQVNLSGLDLHPPVTFRLKHGSGPVFVGAEHVACEFALDLINVKMPF